MSKKKIVIINQAVNYLTVDIANAFDNKFDKVVLLTGSIHEQGDSLNTSINVVKIFPYNGSTMFSKISSWLIGSFQILFKLLLGFKNYEVFFISNPPMAYLMMIFVPKRFNLLIWDIYPDLLTNMGISASNFIYKIWASGNRKVFKRASIIYTIGNRMKKSLTRYVSEEKIDIVPLWTTFKVFEKIPKHKNPFVDKYDLHNKFIVQYSGNIGFTHDVGILVDAAIKLKNNDNIMFMIIGKGERLESIKEKIDKNNLQNCLVLPFQDDDVFPYSLSSADLGVAIVEGRGTSSGNVPSKIYNLMAVGIPILYISSRESELNDYAATFKNGVCYEGNELDEIVRFIVKASNDKELQTEMSKNSIVASRQFTKENANKLAEKVYSQPIHQ